MSSAFECGHRRELRPSDQEAKSDGSIEVGDALAVGGKRMAVANKQAENHIIDRAVVIVRCGERKAGNGYRSSRIVLSINQPAPQRQPSSARMPRVTTVGKASHLCSGLGHGRQHYISGWIVEVFV